MKIVLALAPVWDSMTPPLALAFLKSSLNQAGYDCKCIDFSTQFRSIMVSALGDKASEDYVASHPETYKGWAKQIARERPDVIGLSLLVSNIKNTALIAKELRELLPEALIVSGGPSLTEPNMNNIREAFTFSDYVIEGEGESIFVDFIRCYEAGGDFSKLKQIWLKDAEGTIRYTGHAPLQNIDKIPLPDFHDFDRSAYPCPDKLPMLFSRGCILNCNYCENKWNHLTQRSREGRNVFEELKRNVREYKIKEYMFNDDSLISYKSFRQIEEYCDLVIAEDLILPWGVYGTRVEKMLTEPYVAKLRRAGMQRVSLGVESFSSKVQHEMGKSSKYDDADKTCRLFVGQGIKTEAWIIYGYPTESDDDFQETLQWFIKNPNALSHVTLNAFGPNPKYMHDKPNVVKYESTRWWEWNGPESTIEKRKERFLLLMDVLESIRRSRPNDFTIHAGDPLYVKYFLKWDSSDKAFLLDKWAELEKQVPVVMQVKTSTAPKRSMLLQEDEILETADEILERLLLNINRQLLVSNPKGNGENDKKLDGYKHKIQQVFALTEGKISEKVFYAITLSEAVERVMADLDAYSEEELSQRVITALAEHTN